VNTSFLRILFVLEAEQNIIDIIGPHNALPFRRGFHFVLKPLVEMK